MATFDKQQVLAKAQEYAPQVEAFLADIVRIPSVNKRDPEVRVAERILQEAQSLGFDSELAAKDPQRPNVLARYGQGDKGFALIGHIDTVAEGDHASWTFPPFDAHIDNGRMLGRGTADNKGGVAISMYTLKLLRELELIDPQQCAVTLAGVADEEAGACSTLGVRYLLDSGKLRAKGAIYTYTSDIVCIGHRGLLRLEIRTKGESIHAGIDAWHQKTSGLNAVTALADILLRLEKLKVATEPVPGFENLGFTITPGTIFNGGVYESIVPEAASAIIDIRLLPGQDGKAVEERVAEIVRAVEQERPGLKTEITKKVDIPGAAIPLDHPLATIAQHYTEVYHGKAWSVAGAGPGNEGYMLIGAGIPTLCGFGATGGNPHAPDEWILLSSLPQTIAIYAGIIHDYLNQL
jgi:acetylornithine deacetylase/succinyl-diaminopimelate desuccinylase-like protein